jgi:hypothetical protein
MPGTMPDADPSRVDPPARSQPGETPRAPLQRAPGERYVPPVSTSGPEPAAGWPVPAFAVAIALALGGAALLVVLGGLLSMTAGLLVIAGATGWLVGRALATPGDMAPATRRTVAIVLALGSVALGQVGLWLYARSLGGALEPIEYLSETWGPLVPLQLLAAAVAAWWAAR